MYIANCRQLPEINNLFGFNEMLLRKQEEYQGDSYEYNL